MSLQDPSPDELLAAYARGLFPMADRASGELVWHSPDPRAILPLDRFEIPSGMRRVLRSGRFEIRLDTEFEAVMRACATPRCPGDEQWIDERLITLYGRLHAMGTAHTVEAWRQGVLVGGLYGVRLGAAFFAESMFHRAEAGGSDASKVCLVRLVEILRAGGFDLVDVQYLTPHLARFGCLEIPRADYLERLARALRRTAAWPPERAALRRSG